MIRTLPRPLVIPWRPAALALYVGVNVGLVLHFRPVPGIAHPDWQLWEAIQTEPMYATGTVAPFVWSPPAGWIMALVPFLGVWAWAALHVVALALIRDWRVIGLAAVSWGFWEELAGGNTMTFVFVAGLLALRGSRPASVAYFALLFLMPRPLMLPLAAWLLWHNRSLLVPVGIVGAVVGGATLASGQAGEWVAAVMAHGDPIGNFAPSFLVGTWAWLAVGIPLGVWLTLRGHVGWAGLAVSPYWLAYYLLVPLWEVGPRSGSYRGAMDRKRDTVMIRSWFFLSR